MGQWKNLLNNLTVAQRVTILVLALAVGLGLFTLVRWRRESNFRPLYTGLSAEDAGAVVARLRETGADYRLSEDGGTVLVPSESAAELRLQMASVGLPKSGRIGFELFDRNTFGATEFTEQVNYRRALEGELERSVMSMAEVEKARVHLTFPKDSVFLESRQPAKASVMVKLRTGARLTAGNVQAIAHLAASAVEGLAPEMVSVLDMHGNLLNRPKRALPGEGEEASEAALSYRQSVEWDLLAKIHSTLDPLLGAEKFRAGVSADCDFSSGEQSEETFDPARSVMLTSQKTEEMTGAGGASGVPGTASNLPRPTSRPGAASSGVSRRTENISYQSSRIVRRVKLPQGTLRRLSIAVLIDQGARWEGEGAKRRRVLEPPPPDKLKSIRDVVAAATGLQPDRGDQLIVESLPFESTLRDEPMVSAPVPAPAPSGGWPPWLEPLARAPKWVQWAMTGAAVLLLVLAAGAVLFFRRRGHLEAEASTQASLPQGTGAASAGAAVATSKGERRLDAEAAALLELGPAPTKKSDVLVAHLREQIKKDPAAPAQVLQTWLTEERE